MSILLVLLGIQILVSKSGEAAKILAVFPTPSLSHQVVFRTMTQELAKRGHDVTVVTPDPAFPQGKTPPNLREIDVHDISYKIWRETFVKASKGSKTELLGQMEIAVDVMSVIFDSQLQNEEVQEIITKRSNDTYDLLLLEACIRPALVLSHIFKAPVISVSSFGGLPWHYEMMGVPEHPILYPGIFRVRTHNLTMFEKFKEIYNNYKLAKIYENKIPFQDEMLKRRFGPDTPGVKELISNVQMLFLNTYPVFERIRPVPPNIIHMGGIHQNPTKELPLNLKRYLDSSKHGVIYVSFGTNVNSNLLPRKKVLTLVNGLSKLPLDVLFKWDSEELPGCSDNIKISKWLPQSDLLKHPNIKLFITQGGLQSTDEAITAGVPLIGIPMLADQWYNVENYVRHGIGIQLDLETLKEEQLINAINKVIRDESYRRNVVNLRTLMTDQPMTPLERAMWWIEYVLRHGGAKHLRSPAANMSWWEFLEVDLILTILMAFLLFLIPNLYLVYKYACNIKIKIKTC